MCERGHGCGEVREGGDMAGGCEGVWIEGKGCGERAGGCGESRGEERGLGCGDRTGGCGERPGGVEREQGMWREGRGDMERGDGERAGVWIEGRRCGNRAGGVETLERGQGMWREGRGCGKRVGGCVERAGVWRGYEGRSV